MAAGRWWPSTYAAAAAASPPHREATASIEDIGDTAGRDWPEAWRHLTMPVALVRCLRPLNGGLVVPDDVAADIASTAPDVTVVDVDADHFTVMAHEPAAQALRALVS